MKTCFLLYYEGHVDPGETDLQAAIRETEEEAGLKEKDISVIHGFETVLKVWSSTVFYLDAH